MWSKLFDFDKFAAVDTALCTGFWSCITFVFQAAYGTLPGFGARHNKLPWYEMKDFGGDPSKRVSYITQQVIIVKGK